ncbi:MAG: hypothetical protein NC408_00525 [Candidatus Gastranaerophilales bacterium]|nr:hypothetical protein [Candidatus Gastranaerophilales bacterium]MCM1073516.1 hypothetical protein [Bacteroides sp.]
MSIPDIKNILNTQFTRDAKVDYKTENRAVSIWFEKWDTDKSGDFNDAEWAQYQADMKKAEERKAEMEKVFVNKDTVSAYTIKLNELENKYKALESKFASIDNSSWDKLLEFEQQHPGLIREGIADNDKLPKGAYEFDISALEVGIYDEANDCFTGECYQRGYVAGLETLTDEERQEYLQLLENSLNSAKALREYVEEANSLEAEYDKCAALKDMAETGVFNDVLSPKDETRLYSQYVNIRNNANPFYKEIKEVEQKMTALRLKGTKTDADLKQIEQYQIQLNQLYAASSQWCLADCDERPSLDEEDAAEEIPAPKFQLTDLSGTVSYSDGNLSEINSVGVVWNPNDSVNLSANFNHTVAMSSDDKNISNSVDANLEVGYSNDDFNAAATANINHTPEMTTYTQGVNLSYQNLSADVTETINSTEEGQVNTTSASLTYKAGKYTTTGNAEFTESGNTFGLSSSADYNVALGSSASLKISPKISGSYNDATRDWMLTPTMNLYSEIQGENAKAIFTANESHVTTFGREAVSMNHNFTATGNVEVKNWSFGAKFNDSDTPDSHSNTYGLNASYKINDVGTIRAEVSHEVSRTKGSAERTNSNMFTISFAAPLDAIGKLFGKK